MEKEGFTRCWWWCFCAEAKMSGKGPGLFSAIGKIGRDILMKDYNSDQRFTFSSSSTNSGLDLKSTLVKSRGLSSGDVAAAFKYKNKAVNVKVDTESNVLTTFTVSDVVPSVKTIALIRLPDYNSGKVLRLSWDKRLEYSVQVCYLGLLFRKGVLRHC
ncbi:hypothetical protein GLYMA_17G235700v4 [Glycine max]|nr:hypothetical protein GLYMA_17G235700v4 [Glycine max]